MDKSSEKIWQDIKSIITEVYNHVLFKRKEKKNNWLSIIADQRRAAKASGNKNLFKTLNADFQREARNDAEIF